MSRSTYSSFINVEDINPARRPEDTDVAENERTPAARSATPTTNETETTVSDAGKRLR
jgi:hypothetical protein